MTLSVQFATLLSMIGTGMGMAWIYDIYSWFRRKIHPHPIIVFLVDVVYWIVFAGFVFLVLTKVNDGKVRISLFFGLLIGSIIYFSFFSKALLEFWDTLIGWILGIFRFIVKLIHTLVIQPITWLFHLLLTILIAIWTGFRAVIIWLSKLFYRFIRTIFKQIKRLALALFQFLGKIFTSIFSKKSQDK